MCGEEDWGNVVVQGVIREVVRDIEWKMRDGGGV